MYLPEDYCYRITKEFEPNPNTGKYELRLYIIEFQVDFFFETLKEIEDNLIPIIKGLMDTRVNIQKLELPKPIKFYHISRSIL